MFSNHFRNNFLKYTVALSAAVHLIVFYFFPALIAFPKPDREKVIRVKSVLEEKVKPEDKNLPELENKIEEKMALREKPPEINRPKSRPKSDIIKSVKAFKNAPSLASIRNPVPIRYSEEIFKPVNTVQENASIPHPVSEIKTQAQLVVPHAIQPMPRVNRVESQEPEVHAAVSKKVILLKEFNDSLDIINRVKSFQPAPAATKTPSSAKTGSLYSNVQVKYFTEVNFKGPLKPTVSASSRLNEERFPPTRPVQTEGVQARTPKSLDVVAQYQPAHPIARNYFSAPLRSANLLQEASIPSGFSEENLDPDGKLPSRTPAKVASLGGGVGEISEEGLRKIKNGFSSQVWEKIAQVKYYPRIARDRGFEGQPVVAFTLGNRGELLELSIANPSPFKLLDEAALDAIKSASPYPPIPDLLKLKSIKFTVPIPYTLEER